MQLLVLKCLVGLLAYDLCRLGHNFARLHAVVHHFPISNRNSRSETAAEVCKALNYACVWYPKRVLCLQRSTVTTCMLRRSGFAAQMVIGAQPIPFKAHAWTELDGRTINEPHDVQTAYGVCDRC